MTVAIRTEHLRKVYESGLRRRQLVAVDDLNLEIRQGEVFGFLGLNGAGKTTSVMMLLDCVRPTSGRGELFGKPLGDPEARRRVGFLPERFRFHDFLTARELMRLHGRLSGLSKRECRSRIDGTLELVGLAERSDTPIREFSKGMQQRIGLAQALLPDPDLLILDEPTSGLDPLGRREVRDVILRLRSAGKTVFLNSHLLSEIELCCDRVAILHKGRIVRDGPIRELVAPEARVEIQATALTDSSPTRLAELPGVRDAEAVPDGLRVRLEDMSVVADVVRALVEQGAGIRSVTPIQESLEDFFVRSVEDIDA